MLRPRVRHDTIAYTLSFRHPTMTFSTGQIAVDQPRPRFNSAEAALELPGVIVPGRKARSPLADAVHTIRRKPLAMVGLGILLGWLALGILAPVLPIQDPNFQDLSQKLQGPSAAHPLGTDDLGRDMISRVIWGARVSVPAGILVIALTGIVGCLVGAIAGYTGGIVDNAIMRTADAILSFPSIILAMAITAARGGPGLSNALLAVAIVLTAGLSFIGLGAVPPDPEWGAMIKQGADKGLQYWWYAAAPGLAIMSVVMGLNFFGDGLRDALDPRRRGR